MEDDFVKDFEELKVMAEELDSVIHLIDSTNEEDLAAYSDLGERYRKRLIVIVQKHRVRLSQEEIESLIGFETMIKRYGEEDGKKYILQKF